ncbi:carbohydrate ABC transporter permease [Sinomonas humi]|uniref:Transporter n=1 Tax=Sinomonas humi TaxID=1338436 RepID=A0A0B2ANQ9_9MICC|nr:sugar ABC transporter permease [Sinomonas humi]KHL03557.1 transporter [Sinomonas humi]
MSTDSIADQMGPAKRGVGVAGSGRSAGPRKKNTRVRAKAWTYIIFTAPALILLLLINLYPVIYAAYQSLRNGTLIQGGDFVGFANYINTLISGNLTPAFWQAALFTLIFTLVGVFGSWVIGLVLALLLRTRIPAGGVFKVLLLLPWIVPVVVSAFSWNWLVATPQSPFPMLAQALGLGNVLFLANPTLAKITVCVFKVWISFPFMMMMMSSALASVDNNVYEAARVDGAGSWQTFSQITLPLISRSTYISWILMTIFCVNDFPTIFLLTGGGPVGSTTSLVVLAYRTVFENFQVGPGVAIAFMTTIVLIVVSVILYRQIRKASVE